MNTYRKRFWPLRHKSVITPPVRKVISKPENFEVDCCVNNSDEVNIATLCSFFNERFGASFNWNPYVGIVDLRIHWDNFKKVLESYVDKPSFERRPFDNNVTFRFKEKQEAPGFRKMKFSKKSRFHPQNLCKTN